MDVETEIRYPNASSSGWQIALIPDGTGYYYTATHTGVLWASGWVRADLDSEARDLAMIVANLARKASMI